MVIDYYYIFSNICLFLFSLFFLSPFFFIKYEIGICSGNRVIVRRSYTIENVYQERVYYLNQGDLFLIKRKAESSSNDYSFEAVISKQVILKSNPPNIHFKTYILPIQISCMIKYHIQNNVPKYKIDLLTYERDGKPKRYSNDNVPEDSFVRAENIPKYHVFSKFGNQLLKERFINRIKKDNINWYICVLSIFINLIGTKINDLYKKSYREEDRLIGFDNFQNVQPEQLELAN